jgi:hypothetical protein
MIGGLSGTIYRSQVASLNYGGEEPYCRCDGKELFYIAGK